MPGARLSRRSFVPSDSNTISQAVASARARQALRFDLTLSNPTQADLDYDAEAILSALRDPRALRYAPEPLGMWEARQAVARDSCHPLSGLDAEDVWLTASTSEAYSMLLKVLCDPGDEVLVPTPSYPLLEHLCRYESVVAVPYRLQYDGEWFVDHGSIADALGPRTRALLIVSPNNPTGTYLKQEELARLSELGLPLICDEVFTSYPLGDRGPRACPLAQVQVPAFVLGGLSKRAGLPQLKASWIVANRAPEVPAIRHRVEHLADAFLSLSTPTQLALPRLLMASRTTQRAIHDRVRANWSQLNQALPATSAVSVLTSEGGWYATLRVPNTLSEEAWVLGLLSQQGVFVHPGYFFDFHDEAFLVLSLLPPEAVFREGSERLLSHVDGSA